jgi:hypothetical protein
MVHRPLNGRADVVVELDRVEVGWNDVGIRRVGSGL